MLPSCPSNHRSSAQLDFAHMDVNPEQQHLRLLDLPTACLVNIVRSIHSASRLALFSTCRTLKNLVLDNAVSTSMQLQPLYLRQEKMLKALELIHQHDKKVAVCMRNKQQQDYQVLSKAEVMAERSCSLLHQAQLLGYLDRVTSLELVGAEVAMPLLSVFSDSCPNLTALTLQDCNITWEGVTADSFSAGFSKLQALHLHNITGLAPSDVCQQALQQQVARLLGLKSLQLTVVSGGHLQTDCVPVYDAITAALTPTIVSQLVQFATSGHCRRACQWQYIQLEQLQVLQLMGPDGWLTDQLMPKLLSLPNLRTLAFEGVKFFKSFRAKVCQWEELATKHIALQSLARFPLHSNLQIKSASCRPIRVFSPVPVTRAYIQEALDNITTSKWGGWKGAHVSQMVCEGLNRPGMMEVLPLYRGVGRLVLTGGCGCFYTSTDGMAGFGELVAVQEQGFVLDLSQARVWNVNQAARVVSHMPAGSSLVVSGASVIDVIRLCCAAQCSFALHVKERVKAALMQAGCKEVAVHDAWVTHPTQGPDWDWVVTLSLGTGIDNVAPYHDSLSWAASLRAMSR